MAFEYLNPVAAIWLQSGLRYLIQPEETVPEAEPAAEARSVAARPARSPATSRPASVAPSPETKGDAWRPLPVEDWPEEWQALFARTKKGRIAWTYAKLGPDLLAAARPQTDAGEAQARAARSRILRRILAGLAHPAGTHTFWPAQLTLDGSPEIEIFWSGLQALGCRGVILLDPDYARLLCKDGQLRPYMQGKIRTHFIWPLPPIESLAEADFQRIIPYLRGALKRFAGVS